MLGLIDPIVVIFRCAGKECGGVMEDALMAVSTLIEGFYFLKFL